MRVSVVVDDGRFLSDEWETKEKKEDSKREGGRKQEK